MGERKGTYNISISGFVLSMEIDKTAEYQDEINDLLSNEEGIDMSKVIVL